MSTDSKKDYKFGWEKWQPECLQRFHTAGWLCFLMCLISFNQGFMIIGFFQGIAAQLERRFHMSSDEIGVIDVMYEIGVLVMMFPVAHYGSFGHKGRWIGYSAIVAGAGGLFMAAPHFLAGTYAYGVPRDTYCNANVTSNIEQACQRSGLNTWKYMFIFGNFLHGVGLAPCWTLLIAYIDENVSQRTSGLYLGFVGASNMFGSCIGYLFAGACLRLYGDFHKIDMLQLKMTVNDPRWYGAWYFGPICSAGLYFILAPIILGYGRRLPGADKARKDDIDQAHSSPDIAHQAEALAGVSFLCRLKLLLRNPTYMGLLGEHVFSNFFLNGFALFFAKYLETQFSMSSSAAALYSSAAVVPAAVFGHLTGTFIVRQLRLRCSGMLVTSALSTASAGVSLFFYLVYCPTVRFAPDNSHVLSCGDLCGCDMANYEPVCSNDLNLTFFSKCHAGCHTPMEGKNFSECACNQDSKPVIDGMCKTTCSSKKAPVFLMGLSLLVFCILIKRNPLEQSTLRCVQFELRTLALSFASIPARLLGSIPASPIFGELINRACLVWQEKCGDKEVCMIYNNGRLAESLLVSGTVLIFLAFFSLIFAWCSYRSPPTSESKEENDTTVLEEAAKSIVEY